MAGGAGDAAQAIGLDDARKLIVENVVTYGTHVVQVDGDAAHAYSYTIGLAYNYDHPELIVFGRKAGWRQWLLNAIRDEILGGTRFVPGAAYGGILEHLHLAVAPVPDAALGAYFTLAAWFYDELAPQCAPLRARQIVWPDSRDLLPWEDGYDAPSAQRLLEPGAQR